MTFPLTEKSQKFRQSTAYKFQRVKVSMLATPLVVTTPTCPYVSFKIYHVFTIRFSRISLWYAGDPGLPKWYNSWDEYPFEKFPVYPAGRQIFYSRAAVQELYMASAYVKHLGVDDAYIGIIAAKLGLWLTDLSPFIIDHNGGEPEPNPRMEVRRQLISWHVPGNVSKVRSLWREIQGDVPTRAKTIYFPCCGKSPWFWILQYSGFQLGKLFDHPQKESFQK